MKKLWHDLAWNQYLEWQGLDRRTLKRINTLITSIERNGYDSIGKPKLLTGKQGHEDIQADPTRDAEI